MRNRFNINESEKNRIKELHNIVKKTLNESQLLLEKAACKNEGASCIRPNPWKVEKGCFKTGTSGCYCAKKGDHCTGSDSLGGAGCCTCPCPPHVCGSCKHSCCEKDDARGEHVYDFHKVMNESQLLNEEVACYYNRKNWGGGFTCVRRGCGFSPSNAGGWQNDCPGMQICSWEDDPSCGAESVGGTPGTTNDFFAHGDYDFETPDPYMEINESQLLNETCVCRDSVGNTVTTDCIPGMSLVPITGEWCCSNTIPIEDVCADKCLESASESTSCLDNVEGGCKCRGGTYYLVSLVVLVQMKYVENLVVAVDVESRIKRHIVMMI